MINQYLNLEGIQSIRILPKHIKFLIEKKMGFFVKNDIK